LEAALKRLVDPTRNVSQAFWGKAPTIAKSSVNWERVGVPELFNDHELHQQSPNVAGRGPIDCGRASDSALDVLYSQRKPAFFLSYATVAPIEAAGIYVPARRLPLNFGITTFPSQLQY
jgi:hypothetical protein